VTEWLQRKKDKVITLRPISPDSNPIEKVWEWMKKFVRRDLLNTKEAIVEALEEAWEAHPNEEFKKHVQHLPKTLGQILKDGRKKASLS